jgi:glycosyltransferase involved in cell wall biosynthesis
LQRVYGSDAVIKSPDELYYARTVRGSLTVSKDSGIFTYAEGKLSLAASPPRKAYEEHFTDWQKKNKINLYIPFPQLSRPFKLGADEQNASPSLGQQRIGTMASFPARRESLKGVLTHILPQIDELRLYLNDYDEIPDFAHDPKIRVVLGKDAEGDLRDNGKFHDLPATDAYIFTLDDDLNYPSDYVMRLIHQIEMLGRACVVGVHGVIFPRGTFTKLAERKVFNFKDAHTGHFVDLLGTGTAAWHSSCFQLTLNEFASKGQCDLWFAAAAARQDVPLFIIPRAKRWLTEHVRHEDCLYREAVAQPDEYFQTYNTLIATSLQKGRVRREMTEHLGRCYDRDTLEAAGIAIPENAARTIDKLVYSRRPLINRDPLPVSGVLTAPREPEEKLHFHIVVNGWNCRSYLNPCLRSIAQQLPGNYLFDVTLIDDYSSDGTDEDLARTAILPHAKLMRITKNTGPAHARHVGIKAIENPDTIVVLLDMDDALEPHALRTVAQRYLDNPDCLMTIGNWHDQDGKKNPQDFYAAEEIDNQRIRDSELFNAAPLRTFRRRLYDAIEATDLLDREGNWLETCTDVALMYPLMDQCGSHEVIFIDEPIYRYTRKHGSGTLARFGKPHKVERLTWLKSKTPKVRLVDRLSTIDGNDRIINTAPTVIFGNPRSGTRMCANVLHQHPGICVTDETLNLPRMIEAVAYACNRHLKKYQSGRELQRRREILAKAFWITRSTNGVMNRLGTASHVVNKTPRLEHRFDELEELFQTTPPRYVYCVRNAFGVLKSIKNLPNLSWNVNTIETNLENYLSSLRQYDKIVQTAPDRVVVINIDELKAMPSNFAMYEKVFDLMGLPPVPKGIRTKINEMGKQNSMVLVHQKTGVKSDIQDLLPEEVETIMQNEEYRDFAVRFNLSLMPS